MASLFRFRRLLWCFCLLLSRSEICLSQRIHSRRLGQLLRCHRSKFHLHLWPLESCYNSNLYSGHEQANWHLKPSALSDQIWHTIDKTAAEAGTTQEATFLS